MTNKQILKKSIIWRVIATLITFFSAWIITGSLEFGTAISSVDFFLKFAGYFVYEKQWNKHNEGNNRVREAPPTEK